jgi:NCAIR mutase (PurE)-related protein
MSYKTLTELLEAVAAGALTPGAALERWREMAQEDLGYARIDHHRQWRKGYAEVIYGPGKSAEQIAGIAQALVQRGAAVLATRVDKVKAAAILEILPELTYHEQCACLSLGASSPPPPGRGVVGVVAAGTSDLPVAEEAALTAQLMGSRVERLWDVGVAGLHRLLAHQRLLQTASCLVVAAGMEGALPSVVAGLCACPVLALPTSAGYGASFGGLAALLAMLNSCAPGISVVNIDNGFGAGYLAGLIDHSQCSGA